MSKTARRCLSVVIPCYNERATVLEVTRRVLSSPFVAEVLIVDDASNDGTRDVIKRIEDPRVRVFEQPVNLGKGAALRRGFREARSEFVIVQDADLEYDPADYGAVLAPLLADKADVVYGSRFLGGRDRRVLYYWHSVGNRFLTAISNMLTNLNVSDMETCYKAFRRDVIQSIEIEEDRFGFEPEITAKIARGGWRVYEVGISYSGRTYAEGKKIGWRDGVRAVYCVLRYSRLGDGTKHRAVDRSLGPAAFDESDNELAASLDSLDGAHNYTDWIYSMCKPYLGRTVLEVGAGHGALTRVLSDRRIVTATDVSKRCADLLTELFAATPNVSVRAVALSDMDQSERYDSVVLVNVLEHIEDDVAALRTIHGLLRPGGHVLLFAPAFAALYSDYDRRVGHHRRYRRTELIERADAVGLEVVDAYYVSQGGALLWWTYARQLGQTPTRPTNVRLYDRVLVPIVRRLEERHRPRFGQSVFLVARRPA